MKNGVPWDVAFQLDDTWRNALWIIFQELEGGEFDWQTLRWKELKTK